MFGENSRMATRGFGSKSCLLSALLLAACGQDPAFTENQVSSSDQIESSDPNPNSDSTSPTDSVSQTDGSNTGEDSTDPSQDQSSNPPVYIPPPGYPSGTPASDVLVEDGGQLALPGVKAVKVGVNFEDLSDFDLNDSVLCFTGDFKVSNAVVTSYKKQTVTAGITKNSDCGHNIHVTIKDKNGVVTQKFSYDDRVTTSAKLNFDVGSSLWVVMENQPNNSGCIGPIAMNHPSRAEVKPNLCRR